MWACANVPAAHRIGRLRIVSQRSRTGWFVLVLVTLNGASLCFVIQSKRGTSLLNYIQGCFNLNRDCIIFAVSTVSANMQWRLLLLLIKDFSPGSLGCQCVFARYPALSWIASHCLCIIPCLYVMVYCKSRVCQAQMLLMKDIWQAHVATHGVQGPTGVKAPVGNNPAFLPETENRGLNIAVFWGSIELKILNLVRQRKNNELKMGPLSYDLKPAIHLIF